MKTINREIENYLVNNINKTGAFLIVLILILYNVNIENIKNIYKIHSSELKQNIEEMQGKIETLDIHKSRAIFSSCRKIGFELSYGNMVV